MNVLFDAEPLLAFAFDEPGATAVESWLDRVYDGEVDGYVTTLNLAEFRYVASRRASAERGDEFVADLRDVGLETYGVDDLWRAASALKARFSLPLGDAYALAAASDIDTNGVDVTLLVGRDDDYDGFEDHDEYGHLLERFRADPD